MTADTTITPLATYRNETPYPFCPGCGHGPILDRLNQALVRLQLDPRQVVLVSDIGCSGLSDQYFVTSAFHGLHGRSITYASGIKLARPELRVIVIMGDGGTGIGGTHLINAARRNIGVTVLVFNNLNFGMTGGQHSTTTPTGAVTATTREGNLERPLDICAMAAANGAGYAWRGTSFDDDLAATMAEAIAWDGFAVLDIWELCTAYYVRNNRFSRTALFATLEEQGLATGIVVRRQLPEYAVAYRQAHPTGERLVAPAPLEILFGSPLKEKLRIVVAGSAGSKVRSAVRLFGQAAILSGLWVTQRDDYPVTVQTGHSLSELILSPRQVGYAGISRPDVLLILSEDGRRKAAGYLRSMTAADRLFVLPRFARLETAAPISVLDPALSPVAVQRKDEALFALAAANERLALIPGEALEEAARRGAAAFREQSLRAIAAGRTLQGGR